jgi:hypothetical protein
MKEAQFKTALFYRDLSFFMQSIQYFKNNAITGLTAPLKIHNIRITS